LWVNHANEQLREDEFSKEYLIGEVYQRSVDDVLSLGGVPVLCHPLWGWAFDYEKIKGVSGWKHFELCNASPGSNSMSISAMPHSKICGTYC
jgi:hypothetical protein